jgi:hypothetical protein
MNMSIAVYRYILFQPSVTHASRGTETNSFDFFSRHLNERLMFCSLSHIGETLTGKLVDRLRNRCIQTCQIWNLYGPAETTLGASYYQIPCILNQTSIPIGQPFPNYRCLIVDDFLQPAISGCQGELLVGGVGVFAGYLGHDELTKQVLISIDGHLFYRTGDLVKLDNKGYLYYVGRKDHQIKLRGQRIELGEIEGCILGASAQVTACVVDRWNENHLVAYIQSYDIEERQVREHCREHLPPFMMPSVFVLLKQLPLNSNGKIDRKRLPLPDFSSSMAKAPDISDPLKNPIEQQVHDLWCGVLQLKNVKIPTSSNFFSIGGHSLLAIELYHTYQLSFNFDSDSSILALFLRAATIVEHAKVLETLKSSGRNSKQWLPLNIRKGTVEVSVILDSNATCIYVWQTRKS